MRAGSMRCPITITAPLTAQDAFGQPIADTNTPGPVLHCFAAITAVTGRDVYALGAGFTEQVSHKIVLRWTPLPIAAGMTVVYGDRTFIIQAVSDPDERRRELDLMVLEQTK